jgi:hypothetical protein
LRHYRWAKHDVNSLSVYNSSAISLPTMLSLGVPVKPSFHAKAISALELLIEKPPAAAAFQSRYLLGYLFALAYHQ